MQEQVERNGDALRQSPQNITEATCLLVWSPANRRRTMSEKLNRREVLIGAAAFVGAAAALPVTAVEEERRQWSNTARIALKLLQASDEPEIEFRVVRMR